MPYTRLHSETEKFKSPTRTVDVGFHGCKYGFNGPVTDTGYKLISFI